MITTGRSPAPPAPPATAARAGAHTGALLVALACAACIAPLGGCRSDPGLDRIVATFPTAMSIGAAAHAAHWLERDLDSAEDIPESDKADLRARAQILRAHARKLDRALDLFDEGAPQITLANLEARRAALDAQRGTLLHEWSVWNVRHGRKAPEDVPEHFDFSAAMGEGK